MIKTGIGDIPDIKGLKNAITKKQSETEFLADLKARQVYAQSVRQFHSNNSIPDSAKKIKYFEKFKIDIEQGLSRLIMQKSYYLIIITLNLK